MSYVGEELVERAGIEPAGSNLARITRLPRARPIKAHHEHPVPGERI